MSKVKTFDNVFWGCLILFCLVVIGICFLPTLFTSYSEDYNFTTTGPIGDTIGGTMGPFVGIAAAGLTFLAFWVQFKANEQQKVDLKEQKDRSNLENFQNTFFELIKLHKENINELSYYKYDGKDVVRTENRRVFRAIYSECAECFREIRYFSTTFKSNNYLLDNYKKELEETIKIKKIKANVIDLAMIDLAYSITFFGVGMEGESILLNRFKSKYDKEFYSSLLVFIKLKSKREYASDLAIWTTITKFESTTLISLINELKSNVTGSKSIKPNLSAMANAILSNKIQKKYYDGHQHRLGHYFRHLFQSYNFLELNSQLDEKQKYFYAKILRAQLSTYEQSLLFLNSISSLGSDWEYTFKFNNVNSSGGLISKYNLIKNLPGTDFYGIIYKNYFPMVEFDNDDK